MLHTRRTPKEEEVLKTKNITWQQPFGYVKDYDGDTSYPCSYEEVVKELN